MPGRPSTKEAGGDYYQPWLVMLMSDGTAESLFRRHDQSLASAEASIACRFRRETLDGLVQSWEKTMSRLTLALSLLIRQTSWGIALLCIVYAVVEAEWLWLLAGAIAWFICQALALLVACVKPYAGAAAEPPPAAGS